MSASRIPFHGAAAATSLTLLRRADSPAKRLPTPASTRRRTSKTRPRCCTDSVPAMYWMTRLFHIGLGRITVGRSRSRPPVRRLVHDNGPGSREASHCKSARPDAAMSTTSNCRYAASSCRASRSWEHRAREPAVPVRRVREVIGDQKLRVRQRVMTIRSFCPTTARCFPTSLILPPADCPPGGAIRRHRGARARAQSKISFIRQMIRQHLFQPLAPLETCHFTASTLQSKASATSFAASFDR